MLVILFLVILNYNTIIQSSHSRSNSAPTPKAATARPSPIDQALLSYGTAASSVAQQQVLPSNNSDENLFGRTSSDGNLSPRHNNNQSLDKKPLLSHGTAQSPQQQATVSNISIGDYNNALSGTPPIQNTFDRDTETGNKSLKCLVGFGCTVVVVGITVLICEVAKTS